MLFIGCPCYSCSGNDCEDGDAAAINVVTATDDIDATTAADDIDASTAADNFIGAATSNDDFVGAAIATDAAAISTTSTDYAAVDNTSTDDAAVATKFTDDDALLAGTSTDNNTAAVTITYFTDDDDDFDASALDANSLNIHPDNDPNYDVEEEIGEYILSCPEDDMQVEDNSVVLSSEQSMLSQTGEVMLLDGQDGDKAVLSDEGFVEPASDSETMSLSENILPGVEDVPHSEKTFSSVSDIAFDQRTSSVIEDVSSIPDLLTESDLCGDQMNWEVPENVSLDIQ